MKFGFRKPSIKKSLKARTTGRAKKAVKKATNPLYGKKGMGFLTHTRKSIYNKAYNKTSFGIDSITNKAKQKNGQNMKIGNDTYSVNVRVINNSTEDDNKLIYNKNADALQEVFDKCSYYGEEKHIFNNQIINDYKNSTNPNDNLAVAISYLGEGAINRKDAIIYFEKYLNNPTDQTYFSDCYIYSSLANLYECEYMLDKSIAYLQKAIVADTQYSYFYFVRIGNVLLKKDVNLAVEYYEKLKKESIYKQYKEKFDSEYKKMIEKKEKGYVYKPKNKK